MRSFRDNLYLPGICSVHSFEQKYDVLIIHKSDDRWRGNPDNNMFMSIVTQDLDALAEEISNGICSCKSNWMLFILQHTFRLTFPQSIFNMRPLLPYFSRPSIHAFQDISAPKFCLQFLFSHWSLNGEVISNNISIFSPKPGMWKTRASSMFYAARRRFRIKYDMRPGMLQF